MKPDTRSQADRIYDAEWEFGWHGWFCSVDDAQQWTNDLLRTRWWHHRSDVTEVKLTYGLRPSFPLVDTEARKEGTTGYIDVARARLCEQYVAHELAHLLAWPSDHGPKFVKMLLEITGYAMGRKSRARLARLLREQGLR